MINWYALEVDSHTLPNKVNHHPFRESWYPNKAVVIQLHIVMLSQATIRTELH